MKKTLFFILVHLTAAVWSQQITILDYNLALLSEKPNPAIMVPVLIKGDITTVKNLTRLSGGIFKYSSGNIASVEIPGDKIGVFIRNNKIVRMESRTPHIKPLNDTTRAKCHIAEVHNGLSPLAKAYTGDSVLMGIIDTGCDFNHPDFKKSNGKTRIKHIWDHTAFSISPPTPYGYGLEWNASEIDSGICTHTDLLHFGHGTHVSGIAAGNGNGLLLDTALLDSLLTAGKITSGFNGFMGAAPQSDIVIVAYNFNNATPNRIADATHYIYEKAKEEGMPCVINASLGDSYGSHDGKDLEAQLIDNLISEQPGRAFVAAAGNSGGVKFHLGYTVSADTSFTWIKQSSGAINIEVFGDPGSFENIHFSIGVDKVSPSYSFRGNIPFKKVTDGLGTVSKDTLFNSSGKKMAVITSYRQFDGNSYSIQYTIVADSSANYYYRLITTGSGHLDSWNYDYISSGLPSPAIFPDINKFISPDDKQTIVSSFQCSDHVITVANYVNKASHINSNGDLYVKPNTNPNYLDPGSSVGPTRDGRIKPDIAAPGAYTISCSVMSNVPNYRANYPNSMGIGGLHERGGGTSSASPVVAGIAALYLQMRPNISHTELKKALLDCAIKDKYTGSNLPDNNWGYGKANAFDAMTSCAPTSIINIQNNSPEILMIHPNPFSSSTSITYNITEGSGKKNEIIIYNIEGKKVFERQLNTLQGSFIFETSDLRKGLYQLQLISDGEPLKTEKMILN